MDQIIVIFVGNYRAHEHSKGRAAAEEQSFDLQILNNSVTPSQIAFTFSVKACEFLHCAFFARPGILKKESRSFSDAPNCMLICFKLLSNHRV